MTSDITPAPGKLKGLGSVSLTRSMETSIPAMEPKNVKLIYDKEDIRKIGQLKPFSWQPGSSRGGSAKTEGLDEMEEVFKQAGKKIPIIPNEILRGLVIRGGMHFPTYHKVGSLSRLNVPTVLTPRATQMMMQKDYGGSRFPPYYLSRSRTKNIVPTYEAGQPKSSEFLMSLIEWLGRQSG